MARSARMALSTARTKSLIRVRVHIDTLCPWSYITKRSLDSATVRYKAAHPDVDVEVVFKPFILNPQLREDCDKLALYEARFGTANTPSFLSRISAAGALYGIRFSMTGRSGPSQASHTLAALVLQRLGSQAQGRVLDRLFAGYFEDGRNLTDVNWLVRLGTEEGLSAADVRAVLSSEEAGWLIEQQATAAKAEDRVEAVPCVTIQERFRVGGYQASAVFEDLFDRVRLEMLTGPPREWESILNAESM